MRQLGSRVGRSGEDTACRRRCPYSLSGFLSQYQTNNRMVVRTNRMSRASVNAKRYVPYGNEDRNEDHHTNSPMKRAPPKTMAMTPA